MTTNPSDIEKSYRQIVVPVVASIPAIMDNMAAMDAEKNPVELSESDTKELAALFFVKGGMKGLSQKVKETEDETKNIGVPWMLARGIKTVKVAGVGTFSLVGGKNVSISQDTLRKELLRHLSADKVAAILTAVVKETPYDTLQFKPEVAK